MSEDDDVTDTSRDTEAPPAAPAPTSASDPNGTLGSGEPDSDSTGAPGSGEPACCWPAKLGGAASPEHVAAAAADAAAHVAALPALVRALLSEKTDDEYPPLEGTVVTGAIVPSATPFADGGVCGGSNGDGGRVPPTPSLGAAARALSGASGRGVASDAEVSSGTTELEELAGAVLPCSTTGTSGPWSEGP